MSDYGTPPVALYGWFEGEEDCEPPEPDKRWMTIAHREPDGGMGEEIATFVQRKRDGEYRADDERRVMDNAGLVLDAMRRSTDAVALDTLNVMLSAPEWSVSMLEDACAIVRQTGRDEIAGATWMRH